MRFTQVLRSVFTCSMGTIASNKTISKALARSEKLHGGPHTRDQGIDAGNAYARVFWMYSPNELPPNTLSNEDFVSGRQLTMDSMS